MKINNVKLEKSLVDVKELYHQGYHYYTGGKYKEAERIFQLLTQASPFCVDYWMGLGASLQMQKDYQKAVVVFTAAALLDKENKNPYPHAHAADCLWAMQEKEKAGIAIKSALEIAIKDKKHYDLVEKLRFLRKRWMHDHSS